MRTNLAIDDANGTNYSCHGLQVLDSLLSAEPLVAGDPILIGVLQTSKTNAKSEQVPKMLTSLVVVELGGPAMAIHATRNSRLLRRLA